MTNQELKEEIVKALVAEIKITAGEGYEVSHKKVKKNNGVEYQSIEIRKFGKSVSQVFYVDGIITEIENKKISFEKAAKDMLNEYEENKEAEEKLRELEGKWNARLQKM